MLGDGAGWWGRYPLEEYPLSDILAGLRPDAGWRITRPNLTYRCFRVNSPFSDHVAIVTVEGEDHEGWGCRNGFWRAGSVSDRGERRG